MVKQNKQEVSLLPYQLVTIMVAIEDALDYCLDKDAFEVKDSMSSNISLIESLHAIGYKADARRYLRFYKEMVKDWIRCSDDKEEREEYRGLLDELKNVTFKQKPDIETVH